MLKKDLLLRNPLRLLGYGEKNLLNSGEFGAVLARAGVGKTALLIQLALNSLLNEKRVLHISLNDPVNKVTLWYDEVFRNIAGQYDLLQMNEIWDSLLPNRLIMTFQVEGFSAPKLGERLTDLMSQNIFSPDMVIVDGLPLDDSTRPTLAALKDLAKAMNFPMWFTGRTHRHEEDAPNGLPMRISAVADLFETILRMRPETSQIHICAVKGNAVPESNTHLLLDPVTMLIQDGN
ncbi:MAG: AAA family ATPase [Desulfobacterales bacterium]|jgi:hypothetical protein|nr:AAA family ATPase [Desulfobacterales bacterium]